MTAHRQPCIAVIALSALVMWASAAFAQTAPAGKVRPRPQGQPAAPAKAPPRTAQGEIQQTSGARNGQSKTARPPAEQLRIEPLPPELEKILLEWERQSSKIEKLVGEHQRIVYNGVFEVEKRSDGKFYYESPDKGRIDLKGMKIDDAEVSKRVNKKSGQPYRIEADQETRWICTGKEVMNINDDEKTFEMFPLPPDLQGANIINGPLPFLFGMKAEEAKKRFEISFVAEDDPKKNNKNVVWLTARPRQMADKENFQEATIILDRTRYLPHAVKLLDPSGNMETVYNFPANKLHINQTSMVPPIFRNDPFHPTLRGYKMVQQEVVDPRKMKSAQENAGNGREIRQTGGTAPKTAVGPRPPRTKQ